MDGNFLRKFLRKQRFHVLLAILPSSICLTRCTGNYTNKLVEHATAIIGREKACRKNTPQKDLKPKKSGIVNVAWWNVAIRT